MNNINNIGKEINPKDYEYDQTSGALESCLNLSDLELIYNESVLQLRKKFPTIPKDLTSKCVHIEYAQDKRENQEVLLYSDALAVTRTNGGHFLIKKIGDSWKGYVAARIIGRTSPKFDPPEVEQGIKKIIENSERCEIKIKELNQRRT